MTADDLHGKSDILKNGLGVNQAEILENHADIAAQIGNQAALDAWIRQNRRSEPVRRTRFLLAGQQLDQGRFAGAAAADDKDKLTVLDRKS